MMPPPVAEPAAPYERDPELCDEIIAEWRKDWAGRLGKQPDGSILWRVNASDIMRLVERIDAQAATLSAETAARVKAEGERDEARRSKEHTEYWYAVRLERLKDLGKEAGIWPKMAAIIANGTATMTEGNIYDPPTYAQQFNSAMHRADKAEARVRELEEALRPFARVGDTIGLYDADGEPLPYIVMPIMQDGALLKMHVSIDPADFCRARTLLADGQPKPLAPEQPKG